MLASRNLGAFNFKIDQLYEALLARHEEQKSIMLMMESYYARSKKGRKFSPMEIDMPQGRMVKSQYFDGFHCQKRVQNDP